MTLSRPTRMNLASTDASSMTPALSNKLYDPDKSHQPNAKGASLVGQTPP
jgi:hypothetical protein